MRFFFCQDSVSRALKQLKDEEAKLKASKARVEGSNKRLKELQRAHGSSGGARAEELLREATEEVDEGVTDVKQGNLIVQQLKQKIDRGKDGIVKMKAVIAQVVNKTLSLERQQERQDMKYQTLFEQVCRCACARLLVAKYVALAGKQFVCSAGFGFRFVFFSQLICTHTPSLFRCTFMMWLRVE